MHTADNRKTTSSISLTLAVLVTMALAAGCGSGSGSDGKPVNAEVHVVSQNLLHGIACPADSDRCDLPSRVALFVAQLEAANCPEIVAIQEANIATVDLLKDKTADACGGLYNVVWDDDPAVDREVVLTTGKVLGSERIRLAGPLRSALWVRIAAKVGPVDLVTTHLASSSDNRPCDTNSCPPPCEITDTLNTCQARQSADLLDSHMGPGSIGILAGDLNAAPGEPTIQVLLDRGYRDTHAAAGNPPCDPATGSNCTSGRIDDSLVDMTNPASKQAERIDFVMFATKRNCHTFQPTGVFAANGGPAGFANLVYPADHSGVEAILICKTTAANRAANTPSKSASTSTTKAAVAVDPATAEAVTAAFNTLFTGGTDANTKLTALQDADALRESFTARMKSVGALAEQTTVRVENMNQVNPDTVDLTYSILIQGAVVLDALPGQAVKVDGKWLVSRATYCEVATLGADEIPEPCR